MHSKKCRYDEEKSLEIIFVLQGCYWLCGRSALCVFTVCLSACIVLHMCLTRKQKA